MSRCAGLIAAAGASTRMGMPKSLLRFDAQDVFVTRLARTFLAAGLAPVWVTAPPEDALRQALVEALQQRGLRAVHVIDNAAYARGLIGSIESAAAHLASDGDDDVPLIFCPTDAPFAAAHHVLALRDALFTGAAAAHLCVEDVPAHPAGLSAHNVQRAATVDTPRALFGADAASVPARDIRLTWVLNTPDAYRKAFGVEPGCAA